VTSPANTFASSSVILLAGIARADGLLGGKPLFGFTFEGNSVRTTSILGAGASFLHVETSTVRRASSCHQRGQVLMIRHL
jgi:hypothetical protein